ncbi:MBL fold metallo-hydrolase [Streptomyces doebereineriae]|uniref:MBL fold metallo-hydrolase n=1 Tax=Streptomyces doebereineriae TaxID=3075528 RepID=A0ABU2VL18_9ACTN|nr:hypothetical protein [Streptomyces sp. DSM 41640]MDT0485935.1 hypothetical protein [Streptomyces sp. DSM 41640]
MSPTPTSTTTTSPFSCGTSSASASPWAEERRIPSRSRPLPHITPSVRFESLPEELPLGSYLHSLQQLLAQPDATLLPAHGEVLASTQGRVKELLRHHDERLERTLNAVRAGARTGREVASTLPWTRRKLHLDDLDIVHRGLAVIEIGSHLDVLVDRGALSAVDEDGGVRHYSHS